MKKEKIVTIVLSIILFIAPMLMVPDEKYMEYNFLRMILLLICGFILLTVFLVNIKKIKFDSKDILIGTFVLLAIISTLLSLNFKQSIIGAKCRYEGILMIITYVLIYYNAKYYFKRYKNFENILIGCYMAICILAIIQFYMPAKIRIIPIFGKGAHGTLGNTNFMGSFISLILPAFILGYIITNKKKYLVSALISFTVMIMCVARSSWVAFIIYSLITFIYLIIKKNKEYWKRSLILLLGFIICFTAINITEENLVKNKSNIVKDKFNIVKYEITKASTEGIKDSMGSTRIEIWKITSKMVCKVPFFGCGVDCLQDGLKTIMPKENMNYIIRRHEYIDKAHNEYLQIAATMGIPALIVYMTFIGMILISNLKMLHLDNKHMILLTIIISYLVQAFFNISTIGVAPIFWFVLGIASRNDKEIKTQNKVNLL